MSYTWEDLCFLMVLLCREPRAIFPLCFAIWIGSGAHRRGWVHRNAITYFHLVLQYCGIFSCVRTVTDLTVHWHGQAEGTLSSFYKATQNRRCLPLWGCVESLGTLCVDLALLVMKISEEWVCMYYELFYPDNRSIPDPSPFCTSRNLVFVLNELLEKVVWGEKVNMEDVFLFVHAIKKKKLHKSQLERNIETVFEKKIWWCIWIQEEHSSKRNRWLYE